MTDPQIDTLELDAQHGDSASNLADAVKRILKNTTVEAVLASPAIQFGWCRCHLADAGFILRLVRKPQSGERLVVWRARQPRGTRVYFDSLEDLIGLIADGSNALGPK
jgi:hypothetical protein